MVAFSIMILFVSSAILWLLYRAEWRRKHREIINRDRSNDKMPGSTDKQLGDRGKPKRGWFEDDAAGDGNPGKKVHCAKSTPYIIIPFTNSSEIKQVNK